jgi:hypothetical protein
MSLSEAPLVEEALPSSEFYPISIDWMRRTLSFVRIGRETYNSAAFLVPRHIDMGNKVFTFNIDDLLLHARRNPWPAVRTHYVLISAFCCSTLLARYIDQLGSALVLKEPGIIAQLGIIKHTHSDLIRDLERDEWTELVSLSLSLMARVFPTQSSVIVKPSDIGNLLADDLLMHDARTRVLILSVPLRTFILSVLKSPERRDWVRARAKYWHKCVAKALGLESVDLRRMNDATKSAYIWLVANCLWLSVRQGRDRGRVLVMDGDLISSSPSSALRTVMEFFSTPVSDEDIKRAVESDASSHHSKRPAKKYSADQRSLDLLDWEQSYGREASEALEWASRLAAGIGLRVGDGPVVELSRPHAD